MSAKKSKVQVQDSRREKQIIDLFGLTEIPGRLGNDARDEFGNEYELKSATKKSVSTGRDVSFEMIEKWRTAYWIIARGENLESGFSIIEVYFLHPDMLEGWFTKIEDKFKPDVEIRNKVCELLKTRLEKEELDRLHYLISRGLTLNNPHIGWTSYIEKYGTKIDLSRPKEHLRELLIEFPFNG